MSKEEKPLKLGVSIKASIPEKSMKDLASAFLDAVSPFTESLGLLGDNFRFYRIENVLRRIDSARKLAKDSNIKLQPVPPKFLIPYLEKASLEEPVEGKVSKMWDTLLINAAERDGSVSLKFLETLNLMTNKEAKTLQIISERDELHCPADKVHRFTNKLKGKEDNGQNEEYNHMVLESYRENYVPSEIKPVIQDKIDVIYEDIFNRNLNFDHMDMNMKSSYRIKLREILEELASNINVIPRRVELSCRPKDIGNRGTPTFTEWINSDRNAEIVELERLGLVHFNEIACSADNPEGSLDLLVVIPFLTSYGMGFLRACNAKQSIVN